MSGLLSLKHSPLPLVGVSIQTGSPRRTSQAKDCGLPPLENRFRAQGIGVAGFHLHFLIHDKQSGGHALDYQRRVGKVQICTAHDLQVELPTSGEFLKANFEDRVLSEKIKAQIFRFGY